MKRWLLFCLVCLSPPALGANTTESAVPIGADPGRPGLVELARALLQQAADELPGTPRVRVSPLDPRLRLVPCAQAAEPFLPHGSRLLGSLTVGLRCPSAGWTVYTSARIDVALPVVVASRPLARGTMPNPADVHLVERELAMLPMGYLNSVEALAGRRLRRGVRSGTVITPAMLETIPLVQRGETVTLLYDAAGFEVRAEGTALEDAAAGDHLRVRSNSSQRVVHGRVGEGRLVQVLR